MFNINIYIYIYILNKIVDVNYIYKVKYTYVQLSLDIHPGWDITHSVLDIHSLLMQYPFGYIITSVQILVRIFWVRLVRVRVSGKMAKPI